MLIGRLSLLPLLRVFAEREIEQQAVCQFLTDLKPAITMGDVEAAQAEFVRGFVELSNACWSDENVCTARGSIFVSDRYDVQAVLLRPIPIVTNNFFISTRTTAAGISAFFVNNDPSFTDLGFANFFNWERADLDNYAFWIQGDVATVTGTFTGYYDFGRPIKPVPVTTSYVRSKDGELKIVMQHWDKFT